MTRTYKSSVYRHNKGLIGPTKHPYIKQVKTREYALTDDVKRSSGCKVSARSERMGPKPKFQDGKE